MTGREKYNNIILITGDGRNVGKTFLACEVIRSLSGKNQIIGIKSSPHIHTVPVDAKIISKGKGYIVVLEDRISEKDSSLMFQNGAEKVFFIMAEKDRLKTAYRTIEDHLKENIVVAESGGLHEIIHPGLFLFIKKQGKTIEKREYLNYNPMIINSTGSSFHPDPLLDVHAFLKSNSEIYVF